MVSADPERLAPRVRLGRTRYAPAMRHAPVLGLLALLPLLPLAACATPARDGSPFALGTAPMRPADAVGTWALTDNLNNTFNLVLAADGAAWSTWGRADPARPGEVGRWRIEGGRAIVDLTSGWRDELIVAGDAFQAKPTDDPEAKHIAADGFVQESWAPGADRSGPPSNGGRAVKLKGDWIRWIGLWAEADSARQWAFQSDGLAYGGESNPAMGLWHVQADHVSVQWADGSRCELRVKGDHVEVRRTAPDGTASTRRLDRLR